MFEIDVLSDSAPSAVDTQPIITAVQTVLEGEGFHEGVIGIVVVDDPTMQKLNCQYLEHDWPTDVISFPLTCEQRRVEGEIIVSQDMAAREAERFGWSAENELLLYVVHGTLHIVGYDDLNDGDREKMREREQFYLAKCGLQPKYEEGDDIR